MWDGSRDERNGQKAFSFWHDLSLGEAPQPVTPAVPAGEDDSGGGVLVPLVGSLGGVAVAAVAALIGFRVWRGRRRPPA